MLMRYCKTLVTIAALVGMSFQCLAEDATPVSMCDLLVNPGVYNHKLIEVTGSVSRGFEDFTISDLACKSQNMIWLEFGGTKGSEVLYCCGVTTKPERKDVLVVEGIETSIVRDEILKRFDKLTTGKRASQVRTTIRGRYFSGEKRELPGGTFWMGYGHMGMASLLVIQQVVSVERE